MTDMQKKEVRLGKRSRGMAAAACLLLAVLMAACGQVEEPVPVQLSSGIWRRHMRKTAAPMQRKRRMPITDSRQRTPKINRERLRGSQSWKGMSIA